MVACGKPKLRTAMPRLHGPTIVIPAYGGLGYAVIVRQSPMISRRFEGLRSQNVTSNERGGNRYKPFAFTESGVAMLSSVLRSETAIQVNIAIMRAFVMIRQMVSDAKSAPITQLEQKIDKLAEYVDDILRDQNDTNEDVQMQLDNISEVIAELQAGHRIFDKPRRPIGFSKPIDG